MRVEVVRSRPDAALAKTVRAKATGGDGRCLATAFFPWNVLQINPPKGGARMGIDFRLLHLAHGKSPMMQLAWAEKTPAYLPPA